MATSKFEGRSSEISGSALSIPPIESAAEFRARIAPEDAQRAPTACSPRHHLLLSSWLTLKLPPRDYLFGNLLCTTSRWLIYGETGVGKTLFALELAGAVASGKPFLAWEGIRRARVMYLDGEMPAETFKERMELVADQYGSTLELFGYNRDVLGDGEMPPLNTEAGEKWFRKELDLIKPDLVIFDSIMCLLVGSMAEEESWAPIKPMIRAISSRRIAQIWLHHTGHDPTKAFGTKTREWELDTVIALTKTAAEERIKLEFTKARLRTPSTRDQFESRLIYRGELGWQADGAPPAALSRRTKDEPIRRALVAAYDRLAADVTLISGLDGALVRKVAIDNVREEVKSRGFLDTNEKGQISGVGRTLFRRAKIELLNASTFVEADGLIWRP